MSKLYIIGTGPGSLEQMTLRAREAIRECDTIVGYKTYIGLIEEMLQDKEVIALDMMEEVKRARKAVELASEGRVVGLISGGDAGVYGMAGLALETLKENGNPPISVEVIPGVTAMNAAAALLGAPVSHDFASISLSDLLTDWKIIEERVRAAGKADFILILYNPKSRKRIWQIEKVREILMGFRHGTTPVGIVTAAYREKQSVVLTDLKNMLSHDMGMMTTVIVGNSSTFVHDGKMITPRGYHRKYDYKSNCERKM